MATGTIHVIPIDDHVLGLARFAVHEYSKTHDPLVFKGVWTSNVQRVDGKRYWLNLEAADDDESNKYEATVFVTQRGEKVLEQFNPLLQLQA